MRLGKNAKIELLKQVPLFSDLDRKELEHVANAMKQRTFHAGQEIAVEGESAVGTLFVKQSCELTDAPRALKIIVRANYFRKTGQSGVNPQLPTQLTQGQFESSARLEIGVSPQ